MSRQIERARAILDNYDGPPIRIMEVCGTHTHEIFRLGLRGILPGKMEVISGPGCPVCVTPADYIDEAIWLALEKNVTITTFGDLVRVPGSRTSLAGARSKGARVNVVYAPEDGLAYAKAHPDEEVVFLSVGFETTTPAGILALRKAEAEGVGNFTLLTANKTMPGAYLAMADSADVFLYPGHVHAITGTGICEELAREGVSGVIAGFTAAELLTAFAVIAKRYPEGKPFFVNAYPRVVTREGSPAAVKLMEEWMEPCDSEWRGIGMIGKSGLRLRREKADFDARIRFDIPKMEAKVNTACRCGQVLQGACKPSDCPLFGKACNPDHPVGACMVSGEGACSAYYQYGGDLNG